MTTIRIVARILFVCCVIHIPTVAANTCPNSPEVAGHRDIWATFSHMKEQWHRNIFAEDYNLEDDEWDEGWGWSKYNNPNPHLWEFNKMTSAGRLLWAGIDDSLSLQGAWSATHTMTGVLFNQPYPTPSVISRNAHSMDLFTRDASGKLNHTQYSGTPWYPGDLPPDSNSEFVSDFVATEKDAYLIESNPKAVRINADTMSVLARGTERDLYHFQWTASTGWKVENPTTLTVRPTPVHTHDRYFIYSQPVVLRRTGDVIDVFATDNYNHLIHYWYDGGWAAEDLTQKLGDAFKIHNDPVAIHRGYSKLDVFGLNINRELIHFQWTYDAGWSAVNVTQDSESVFKIDGAVSVVSPDGHSLFVYARSSYRLILFLKLPETGFLPGWHDLDLTENRYALTGSPVAISRDNMLVNGFVHDINGHLIHFGFSPGAGFTDEDLSQRMGAIGIGGTPTVLSSHPHRIDVFAQHSLMEYLVHTYWTQALGWQTENINMDPNISPTWHTIGSQPVVVQRNQSALDVFAKRHQDSTRMLHFTSAIGLTLNSWHTNSEYSNWAEGIHHGFEYVPEDDDESSASADDDTITMKCPSFQMIPAELASTMLHEATHAIFHRWKHQANNASSNCTDPCSDNWFQHGVRVPSATLNPSNKNHSMNQMEIEYLCDIDEFPRYDVPLMAYLGASGIANSFMANRILNPPGWECGIPRPLN